MKRSIGFVGALIVVALAGAGWLLGGEEPVVTQPVPLSDASSFRYPIPLWDARMEGETILMVHVTTTGGVDTAYVLTPSGQPAFDSSALAGARDLRFEPGRRGRDSIASWARLPVRFRMPPDSADRGNG